MMEEYEEYLKEHIKEMYRSMGITHWSVNDMCRNGSFQRMCLLLALLDIKSARMFLPVGIDVDGYRNNRGSMAI
jgi:hypothetical protein